MSIKLFILLMALVMSSYFASIFASAQIDVFYHEKLHEEIFNWTGYENITITYGDWGISGLTATTATKYSNRELAIMLNMQVHITGYHNNILILNLWGIYLFSMIFIISMVFLYESRKGHNEE